LKDLLIYDSNELTGKSNEYLKDLARDNAQLLINQIFKRAVLETEIVNDSVVRIAREKIRRYFRPAARKTDSEKVGANKMGSFCDFKRNQREKEKVSNGLVRDHEFMEAALGIYAS